MKTWCSGLIAIATVLTVPFAVTAPPLPGGPFEPTAVRGWEWRAGGDFRGVWFTSPSTGWLAADLGLLKTTDSGHSWSPLADMVGQSFEDVRFTDASHGWAVGAGGLILHTSDSGITWRQQTSGVTVTLHDPVFVDNLWGWVHTRVPQPPIRTTDGGATWRAINMPPDWYEWSEVWVFFVDRQHGWLNWQGSDFYRTGDGGLTWTQTQHPPDDDGPMYFVDALHGWVAGGGGNDKVGYYGVAPHTTDGGESWHTYGVPCGKLDAIQFTSPLSGWVASRHGGAYGKEDGGVCSTGDGGLTWSRVATVKGTNGLHFLNADQGWSVGPGGGVWRTSDGGVSWHVLRGPTVSGTLETVRFLSGATGYAAGESETWYDGWNNEDWGPVNNIYLIRSTDAGLTWSPPAAPPGAYFGFGGAFYRHHLRAVDFLSSTTGWIGWSCYNGFYVQGCVNGTTDGGGSWTAAAEVSSVPEALDMVDERYGWAARSGGLARTTDGGATWTDQASGGLTMRGVDAIDAQHAFAVGDQGVILYTPNGGGSWVHLPAAGTNNLYDLFMLDATNGWAVGDAGTIVHTSNGNNWLRQASGSAANLRGIHFLDSSHGWAAGSGGTILRTTDGGAHWQRETTPYTLDLNDIVMTSETDGWAVGASGLVLHYGGSAVTDSITAPKAGTPPTLDGDPEEWQALASVPLNRDTAAAVVGEDPQPFDLSASLRVAWSPTALYFAGEIGDDVVVGNNSPQIWGDDALELGIRAGSVTHQFTVSADGRQADQGSPITSLMLVTRTSGDGWSLELAIPPAALGLTQFSAETSYAFTFGLWDDDTFSYPGQTHLIWQGTSTNTYSPDWGTLALSSTVFDFRQATNTPTQTPSPTATASLTPTVTPTVASTPTPTSTEAPAATATHTSTVTPSTTPSHSRYLPLIVR